MMKNLEERRKYPRLNTLNLVSYRIYSPDDVSKEGEGIARTLDLSTGGLMIQLNEHVSPGMQLQMVVAINENLIDVQGEIVHVVEIKKGLYDVGVRFSKIDDGQLNLLMDYLKKRDV